MDECKPLIRGGDPRLGPAGTDRPVAGRSVAGTAVEERRGGMGETGGGVDDDGARPAPPRVVTGPLSERDESESESEFRGGLDSSRNGVDPESANYLRCCCEDGAVRPVVSGPGRAVQVDSFETCLASAYGVSAASHSQRLKP
jgi:hypothetical protein